MTQRLYIMRHGPAEERDEKSYPDDRLRPLTVAGIRKVRRVARGMRALDVEFDRLLTSPLVRARQTAELAAAILGFPTDQIIETESLTPDADPAKLFEDKNLRTADQAVLLVGHEPHLSTLISWMLTGDRQALRLAFKTPAVCLIEIDGVPPRGRGTLHWLAQPRLLIRAG